MNRFLFFSHEFDSFVIEQNESEYILEIPKSDYRIQHLNKIIAQNKQNICNIQLRAGVVNISVGILQVREVIESSVICRYEIQKKGKIENPVKIHVLLAHPRPPVFLRLIKDLSTMGVSSIFVYSSDMSEKSYLSSSAWNDVAQKSLLGVMQAQNINVIPSIKSFYTLDMVLQENDIRSIKHKCCFVENSQQMFSQVLCQWQKQTSVEDNFLLSIGAERGLTEKELAQFKNEGFNFYSLGNTTLRTETATTLVVGSLNLFLGEREQS